MNTAAILAAIAVTWNPRPTDEQIGQYRVTAAEVFGMRTIQATTTTTTANLTGLAFDRPYLITVESGNALGWSAPSEPVPFTPRRKVTLTIQSSDELGEFHDVGEPIHMERSHARQFFRLKIETR